MGTPTKFDTRQSEYRALLTMLGIQPFTELDNVVAAMDSELDYPLRPRANAAAADTKLYFSNAQLSASDGSQKVLGALKKTIFTAPTGLWIDFQAGTVSNATYLDVTFLASTLNKFRRCALFFNNQGKIKAAFSAEATTQAALANAGTLLPTGVIPLGYIDLVCTNAVGQFKSATAITNLVIAADIYRFSPGAGGGGGQGTTFDQDQVAHGFAPLDPIYFDGTIWRKAQANNAATLASYVVTEVPNPDQFTASNFGAFEIPNALTPGQYYFVSDTVAGGIQTTEPMFGYSNPVIFCQSATLVHMMVHRPSAIGDGIVSDSDIGAIMAFPGLGAPSGYLFCDGRAVSRVTYADLFTKVGSMYGQGDGSTTFNLPDFRGNFLRGASSGGGPLLAAAVNVATDTITLVSHGLGHSGAKLQISSTGTVPGGLAVNTTYFAIVVDADNFKVATTLANSLAGTTIDITSQGTGTHTIKLWEDPDAATRFAKMLGGATGSSSGTAQDDVFANHTHTGGQLVGPYGGAGSYTGVDAGGDAQTKIFPVAYAGGNETRPKNITVGFFIRFAARGAVKGDSVPSGTILSFGGSVANIPAGYLACDGSSIVRTDFPLLFAAIGTAWGTATGTTFNLPDARGRFLRGYDGVAGNDPDKLTRTATNTGGATGNAVGTLQADDFKAHAHLVYAHSAGGGGGPGNSNWNGANYTVIASEATAPSGGTETRPKNVSVNYIIKV